MVSAGEFPISFVAIGADTAELGLAAPRGSGPISPVNSGCWLRNFGLRRMTNLGCNNRRLGDGFSSRCISGCEQSQSAAAQYSERRDAHGGLLFHVDLHMLAESFFGPLQL